MYFTDGEVYAIRTMLEYWDTSDNMSDLHELIGVLRFKVLDDNFLKESKITEVTANQ